MRCPIGPRCSLDVLLVEDDDAFADWVAEQLGAEALTRVGTLAEAEHLLSWRRFDVILLDLTLPDGAGLTSVDRVLSAPQVPTAIVLTNVTDDALRFAAYERGVQEFCDKSRLTGEADPGGYLCELIRRATSRQRGENERILGTARLFGRAESHDRG